MRELADLKQKTAQAKKRIKEESEAAGRQYVDTHEHMWDAAIDAATESGKDSVTMTMPGLCDNPNITHILDFLREMYPGVYIKREGSNLTFDWGVHNYNRAPKPLPVKSSSDWASTASAWGGNN